MYGIILKSSFIDIFIKDNCTDSQVLDISQISDPEACKKMFADYAAAGHTMY